MARDSIRLEAPAAKAELEWLQTLKVGDVRKAALIPAFEVDAEWTCTKVEATRWELEATFFEQVVFRVVIEVQAEFLTLDVKES